MTRTYPTDTANRNVPKDVFLIAEQSFTSGEIVFTWYITRAGDMAKICDWVSSKPEPVTMHKACQATGDSEQILMFRWRQHFNMT